MAKTIIQKLPLEIEGAKYTWDEQFITGKQLKNLAGLSLKEELYLSLTDPYDDELVNNDDEVDLSRPGKEYFYVKRDLVFTVDGREFHWNKQYINENQIRKIADVSDEFDIYLDSEAGFEDVLIDGDERVNLARPGTERFKTVKADVAVTLVVNARPKSWAKRKITFDEVVVLAFGVYDENPDVVYTVTYDKGPRKNPEGSMVRGDRVRVKDKMIFNVTATNRS